MLRYHHALAQRSRFVSLASHPDAVSAWELAVLTGCGLLATAGVLFLDFDIKLPGHAILRSVVPMSLGLALVPRRGAGFVMSAAALVGLLGFGLGGFSAGAGSTTSLLCTGPLLDAASRQAHHGWRLTASFGLAALLSNVLAFAVRGATRLVTGAGSPGWWSIAPFSYAACGLLAGLICAVIWFRSRPSTQAAADT